MQYFLQYRHCSSPAGVQDSSVVVEEAGGQLENFTAVSWQIGLGDTLCYRCCYSCYRCYSSATRAVKEM